MNHIPSVDLRDFLSEDPSRKQKFINEIHQAFSEIGFVALRGHFLDQKLVDELYGQVKHFFTLEESIKKKYEIAGIGGQRGYTSFGRESAKGSSTGDLKEFWHFGQYDVPQNEDKRTYPDNVWVDEVPGFNQVGKEAFAQLQKTAVYVLRALTYPLALPENYFDEYVLQGNSILRAIHYPPITEAPKNAVRAAAHGDINLITLLMGAHGKGLQVKNHQGQWIDAIASEDELMINVGDMLSRLTNNSLKSTIHQVVNPPQELWGTSRYSIPFFMHPVSSMSLSCLPQCISDAQPKGYEDITAGDFLRERLVELGLIKG
ncbi:MAG TPA: flavonol synthase [Flavobacteriaceae bacterium]|jgi:isopenicillin N synthase-like dioxygenase|nr:flavonol synthase [Flavobacteriaceae bacterium]